MYPFIVAYAIITLSNAHSDLYRFKEYQFTFNVASNSPLRRLVDAENPFRCTDIVMPSTGQKLCVRFDENNELQYKYESTDPITKASASAITNEDDIISTTGDANWNEVSYGQSSSEFSLNDGTNNRQYVKQCRYSNGRRECVHYDSPSNTVTFGIKTATDRIPRDSIDFAHILPANMEANNPFSNPINMASIPFNPFAGFMPFIPSYNDYDSAHQFQYGDALGYDRWAAHALQCVLCDIMNHLDIENIFKSYGDFTYLFDEHAFDYNMDKDWVWKVEQEKKCTANIPHIEHRICAAQSGDGKVLISFEKEANDGSITRRLLGDDVDEVTTALSDEFDGVILDFDDDNVWDEVTDIDSDMHKAPLMRKCRSFQLAQLCATRGDDDYLRFYVKVGTHKLHRKADQIAQNVGSKVNQMLSNLWSAANVAYSNDYNQYEYEQELEDIVDQMEDEYDGEGREAMSDVLEEIADQIEEEMDEQVVEEYEQEVLEEAQEERELEERG